MIYRRAILSSLGALSSLSVFFGLTASTAGVIDIENLGPYQIIRPVSAVMIDRLGVETDIKSVISEGDGLSSENPLTAEHGNQALTMFVAETGSDGPVTVRFDLGQDFNLNDFWVWQYNGEDQSDRGVSRFDILFKNANDEIVSQLIGQELDAANGDPTAPTYFCPLVDCARFIELILWDNHGDTDWIGLSEVLFAGRSKPNFVPEPNGCAMVILVVCAGLASIRRRRACLAEF